MEISERLPLYKMGRSRKNNQKAQSTNSQKPFVKQEEVKSPEIENPATPQTEDVSKDNVSSFKKNILEKALNHSLIATVLGTIIVAFLSNLFLTYKQVGENKRDISDIKTSITEIKDEIKDSSQNTKKSLDDLESEIYSRFDEKFQEISNQIDNLNSDHGVIINITSLNSEETLENEYIKIETVVGGQEYRLSSPKWQSLSYIAKDANTGEKYRAIDLANENLFFHYQIDGQEILFLGQYNEKNHWNGRCVTNIFKNGYLWLISEENYDDGVLRSYRQVFQSTTSRGKDVWNFAIKNFDNIEKIGETWSYLRFKQYAGEINWADLKVDDIIFIEDFKKIIKQNPLEGYYCGNTADGYFNDKTGKAYLIKYFEDGTIRMLYKGNFVHGKPDDSTGYAWDISKETNTDYMRFKGTFVNGEKQPLPDDQKMNRFKNHLSKAEIESYLIEQHFFEETGLVMDDLYWAVE